jgi:aminocarboxymuconate-semialdehyde decarboxylase
VMQGAARRIDIHSHYLSSGVLQEIQRVGERCATPYEKREGAGAFIHTPERPYGPIGPAFYDLDRRLEYMDRSGIDQQLLIAPPFCFYYWSDAPEAYALMRLENDGIAEATRHPSGRFLGFGTVMLQDVKESIRECERIKNLGLLGVEIGSNVNGRGLQEQEFLEFFEAVQSLDLALLVHPHNVAGQERMGDYHLRNLLGFPLDTTLAAAQLIFTGVLDRLPGLRICLGQAGGFLPYIIGRLDAGFLARPECRRHIQMEPSRYLRRFYYDSIIHSAKSSEFLARVVGSERLMFGTDFPFDMGSTSPVAEIEGNSVLTTGERARVFNGSAVEFLRLGEQVH